MRWQKISDTIDRVVDIIGSLMVLTTIICTSLNIFSRWIIGRSLGQLDEISLMAFVWTIYIGMGLLYNRNEHISMDFIIDKLPYTARIIVTIVDIIIELVISVLVTYLAVKLMGRSFIRTTNVTHVPYAYLQLSIVIGFFLLTVSLISKGAKIICALIKKENPFDLEQNGEGGQK